MDRTPLYLVKQLDGHVGRLLRAVDTSKLSSKERDILMSLKQSLGDARIYIQAYELSETREEQSKSAKMANKCLPKAQKYILSASEFNIFSAIDVAHLSAQIEEIQAQLK